MATGVLIMGVGKGTKRLQDFLECSKNYEATVLFGAATDSYDTKGKLLKRASCEHVTRAKVEEALKRFRGQIMQRPPIYSALRMDGKRLYEYAREGKEAPREIEERPVEVKELEVLEWFDRGTHDYHLPEEEAEVEARHLAEKILHLGNSADIPGRERTRASDGETQPSSRTKRKRSLDDAEDEVVTNKRPTLSQEATDPSTLMSGALPPNSNEISPKFHKPRSSPEVRARAPSLVPAVRLRMNVTSGFYVRSLAHDLGEAVGSLACMCALVRTRQGDYELGKNVIEYADIEKDESVWSPQVAALLEASQQQMES